MVVQYSIRAAAAAVGTAPASDLLVHWQTPRQPCSCTMMSL